jgi:hypothetical protein
MDDMGRRLESFPHYRMTGRNEFRLRVGDYRVVYDFNLARNELSLIPTIPAEPGPRSQKRPTAPQSAQNPPQTASVHETAPRKSPEL